MKTIQLPTPDNNKKNFNIINPNKKKQSPWKQDRLVTNEEYELINNIVIGDVPD